MILLIVVSAFMYAMGYIVSLSCLHDLLHPEPCPERVEAFEYILMIIWPIAVAVVVAVSIWDWCREKRIQKQNMREDKY